MYLLLSGEGVSDMGRCEVGESCEPPKFQVGAMAMIVNQLIDSHLQTQYGYELSLLDSELVTYVSESYLAQHKPATSDKKMAIRGKKRPPETMYYFQNARALAIIAKDLSRQLDDTVIAVLFRDADGTASAERGNWVDKYQSMKNGFAVESYELGIAMIPNTKSEAWLLCAVKNNYQHCENLEGIKGNDDSPNSLKSQLTTALNGKTSAVELAELVKDKAVDVERIDMPSFNQFRQDLKLVLDLAHKHS